MDYAIIYIIAFFSSILSPFVGSIIYLICTYKYAMDFEFKGNLKLLKFKVKKNKIDCCFLDVEAEEKYVIHIRRFLLRKKYIPKEFAIENSPRTYYYNHIKSILEIEKEYFVIGYNTESEKKYMLSLEERLE